MRTDLPAAVRRHGTLILALGLAGAAGVLNAMGRSLRLDEAFTLNTALRPLSQTMHQALYFEQQPALYFMLVNLWLHVSRSFVWGRLFSTLCILGTIAVLARIAAEFELRQRWVSLPLLAALCPYLLWAASDLRTYALVMLLNSLATLFWIRVWIIGTERPFRDAGLYTLCAYLALMSFYYSGFLIAAQLLAALIWSRERRLALFAGGALALMLTPWIAVIRTQVGMHIRGTFDQPGQGGIFGRGLALGWTTLGIFYKNLLGGSLLERSYLLAGLAVLTAGLAAARARWGEARWPREGLMIATAALLPFALLMVLDINNLVLVADRHRGIILPPVLIGLALLLARLPARRRALPAVAVTGTFAFFALTFMRTNTSPQDYKAAAAWVTAREHPGEPVFFFDNVGVLPFRPYYRGPNTLAGLPRDYTTEEWSVQVRRLRSEAQLDARVRELVRPGGGFWVVERRYQGRQLRPEVLAGFIRNHTAVLDSTRVSGLTVFHLALPAPGAGP